MPSSSADIGHGPLAGSPFAVVDIGSNSVRLVIYDRLTRSPASLFNEKSLCAIGRSMVTTGVLDEEGVNAALAALARFREVLTAMNIRQIDAVATAAVRDAKNGNQFVARARDALGWPVRVLSGDEEARLAGEGVLSAIPDADGIMGDLGGGSLELAFLSAGSATAGGTLPFGPLRLMDMCDGRAERSRSIVDEGLGRIASLDKVKGKTLYAVGGIWRSIARIHMQDTAHDIRVLHHYELSRERALSFVGFLSGLGRRSLEAIAAVTRRRAEAIPYGAVVMERLIKAARIERVVISAFGLREGVLFSKLPPDERSKDPLIASCSDIAARLGRDPALGSILERWTAPIFPGADGTFDQLRRAACYLADAGWRGHPDHRAEQMFSDVLHSPLIGVDHTGRALLALAMFRRFAGEDEKVTKRIRRFAGETVVERANVLGLALRAALVMAGPAAGLLGKTSVRLAPSTLIVTIPRAHQSLVAEAITKRLEDLADALDRTLRIDLK